MQGVEAYPAAVQRFAVLRHRDGNLEIELTLEMLRHEQRCKSTACIVKQQIERGIVGTAFRPYREANAQGTWCVAGANDAGKHNPLTMGRAEPSDCDRHARLSGQVGMKNKRGGDEIARETAPGVGALDDDLAITKRAALGDAGSFDDAAKLLGARLVESVERFDGAAPLRRTYVGQPWHAHDANQGLAASHRIVEQT